MRIQCSTIYWMDYNIWGWVATKLPIFSHVTGQTYISTTAQKQNRFNSVSKWALTRPSTVKTPNAVKLCILALQLKRNCYKWRF